VAENEEGVLESVPVIVLSYYKHNTDGVTLTETGVSWAQVHVITVDVTTPENEEVVAISVETFEA
jgi:hypothetical protein